MLKIVVSENRVLRKRGNLDNKRGGNLDNKKVFGLPHLFPESAGEVEVDDVLPPLSKAEGEDADDDVLHSSGAWGDGVGIHTVGADGESDGEVQSGDEPDFPPPHEGKKLKKDKHYQSEK